MSPAGTLQQNLSAGAPTLPELEWHAVLHNYFPPGTVAMVENSCEPHWETYNHMLIVSGKAGHTAVAGSDKAGAILKLAHKIIALEGLDDAGNSFVFEG